MGGINISNCIYCGKETENKKLAINPGAKEELHCCSKECKERALSFVDWDIKSRMKFYLLELVFVVLNLLVIGYKLTDRWSFVPFIGMGAVLYFYPLIFTKYASYSRFGIEKTLSIIKKLALGIVVFGIILVVFL